VVCGFSRVLRLQSEEKENRESEHGAEDIGGDTADRENVLQGVN
jgi:hypothetical protein